MISKDVYIVSASRTPIGRFGKSLINTSAPVLGSRAVTSVIKDAGIEPKDIQEVIFGNVIQAGVGQNPAGQVSSLAGLPDKTIKYTVNTVCASGMLAVENASREIMLGERDLIIAGGTENMSRAPLLIPPEMRWGVKQLLAKKVEMNDSMLNDGLLDAFYYEHMGVSADRSANKFGVTREQADSFALRSFQRAERAWKDGEFRKESIEMPELKTDEGIRKTSMEDLSKLKPAFTERGVLTAGNSSQLSDGASALLIASKKAVRDYDLKPIAEITGFTQASLDPRDFVEAPIPATKQLLEQIGHSIDYFDLVEHNEAFSIASIIVRDQLGIDDERFNVNGGAIAIGHPLGNSGSRIIVTLLNALRSRKLSTGLATICHGGGGGHSLSLEVLE